MPKSKTKRLRYFANQSRKKEPLYFWHLSQACHLIAKAYKLQ
jgi:hypothetical protein